MLLAGLYWSARVLLDVYPAASAQAHTYRLSISTPSATQELPVFKVRQGDTVTLVFASGVPGEAHVHGYERKIALKPHGEVVLTFTATDAGLFPLHLHDASGSMYPVGMLVVQPE